MSILFSYFALALHADRKRNFNISVMVVGSRKARLTDWIIQLIEPSVYKKKKRQSNSVTKCLRTCYHWLGNEMNLNNSNNILLHVLNISKKWMTDCIIRSWNKNQRNVWKQLIVDLETKIILNNIVIWPSCTSLQNWTPLMIGGTNKSLNQKQTLSNKSEY